MSDHLLRLAKIVESLAKDAALNLLSPRLMQAKAIVWELESAGIDMPPAPERRTITREELRAAQEQVWRAQDNGENAAAMLERVADVWRLTVEK